MPPRPKVTPKYKIKIKKNDQVVVTAGKNVGQKGRVLRIVADKNRVLVEGVGMIKKHVKADPNKRTQGGIVEQESAIHLSNVMLVDADGKPTRTGSRMEGENKVRFAKTTGATLATKR